MKRNKIATFAIAAVTAISLVSGGVFAWFVTSRETNAVEIDMAQLNLEVNQLGQVSKVNWLPGESVIVQHNGSGEVKNVGDRTTLVQLNFTPTNILLDQAHSSKIPSIHATDYIPSGATRMMTTKRMYEVLEIDFASSGDWAQYTIGTVVSYYAKLAPAESKPVGDITVKLLPEYGGNVPNGHSADDRFYEQNSKIYLAYQVYGVQAQVEAAIDVFGPTDTGAFTTFLNSNGLVSGFRDTADFKAD